MSATEQVKDWYAIQVMSGQEEKVKDLLEKQMTERVRFLIYRRKLRERKQGQWHMVERKLFPGYILMEGTMDEDIWYEMKASDANFKILKNEEEWLTLSDLEVRTLGLLDQNEDGLVDISKLYKDGDQIQVKSGPLMGQEARIVSINKRKGRAKVKLGFCGTDRIIELGVEVLQKL